MGKKKSSDKIPKEKQLKTFGENTESELTLKMDCVICNNTFSKEYSEDDINDYSTIKKEFVKEAYDEGWRKSVSKVFGHIGIHCPECHKNRNNKKHFD